jgi:antitoxin component YwqK of YwqJK toxin-antitoxin module
LAAIIPTLQSTHKLKTTIFFILLTITSCNIFSQTKPPLTDTTKSIYNNLVTRKLYTVFQSSQTVDGVTTYKIDDKTVEKATYEKYNSTSKNVDLCKPCIIKAYNFYDKLVYKAIQYSDCIVGYYIEYFPNGNVKIIGHYKENESGNWQNIFDRGYCQMDGVWTYYDTNGKIRYSETWKDGDFLKQYPKQAKTELWKVEMMYNNKAIDTLLLDETQIKEIQIIPKFKTKMTAGTNITIDMEFSAVGHKIVKQKFSIKNFKDIDIKKILTEIGAKSEEKIICYVMISNNGENISNYSLNIKH